MSKNRFKGKRFKNGLYPASPMPSQLAIEKETQRNTRFEEVLKRIAEGRKQRGVNIPVKGNVERREGHIDEFEKRRAQKAKERTVIKKSPKIQLREEMSCNGKLKIDSKKPVAHFISVGMK